MPCCSRTVGWVPLSSTSHNPSFLIRRSDMRMLRCSWSVNVTRMKRVREIGVSAWRHTSFSTTTVTPDHSIIVWITQARGRLHAGVVLEIKIKKNNKKNQKEKKKNQTKKNKKNKASTNAGSYAMGCTELRPPSQHGAFM